MGRKSADWIILAVTHKIQTSGVGDSIIEIRHIQYSYIDYTYLHIFGWKYVDRFHYDSARFSSAMENYCGMKKGNKYIYRNFT